ncbi:NAD(P)/FAD-dependent oxidoreductase [Marinobacter orientalis]|uniref:NAD(P)-binding protein n=1 Tax=Marinobacter orientalis TaxID=1928859 RepID=A0A7Y0RCF7_9GAMM|nr:FAD-dependent oxidoreductase [Marinobacter orientalis]NMT63673.1 NAD(P)-binding protein [Marinobacter orientalis]TGX49788.1 FAD-binding protein [Marinobacter orientalis]
MFNQTDEMPVIRRIAVVGSGLAGLTAALLLGERNLAVTVFEKSRGPGGRMAAKRVSGGSADIGAQYFTARNPAFVRFLAHHAGDTAFGIWPGRFGYQNRDGKWESFPDERRYVGIPRMTAVTRGLSSAVNVKAQTRVERLIRNGEQWTLRDADGESYGPFDAVIITAPPAQAQELLSNSDLPVLAEELDEPVRHIQPCWAAAAYFPDPLEQPYEGMRCQDDVLYWIANNSSKPGREDKGQWWVLHANPEWSRRHQDTTPEQVTEEMVTAFQRVTGCHQQPGEVVSHRWLYAKSSSSDSPGFRWFGDHRIGLAGDWLSGGRVEGAFESARGLVNRILPD